MPNYKVVDADKLDSDITIVADAIRAKGGTAETLAFPNGMKTAIENIKAGGGTPEGFHAVRFYNDDRTTLLYTVYVPSGSSAIYAGSTPISTVNASGIFRGFEPNAVNVTTDLNCYAAYDIIGTLENTSWRLISKISEDGTAQNYFAVGDTKTIHIEGTIGQLTVNDDFIVYIIGFNHNSELEGNGIHFGTFKIGSYNVALDLTPSKSSTDGTLTFNYNHWGNYNYGGWAGCDLRYDILGSTDVPPSGYGAAVASGRVGYDATETCATNPVPNTLMAALPADLRAVMKPMTKCTDNVGGKTSYQSNVTASIDYLPLLAEYEVFKESSYFANQYEKNYQMQYSYFALGNKITKHNYSNTPYTTNGFSAAVLLRSPSANDEDGVCRSLESSGRYNGTPVRSATTADNSQALAPIFKV